MFQKMAGWSALVVTALVCVATSPPRGNGLQRRLLESFASESVELSQGRTLVRRYKVTLAADANLSNDAGIARTASIALEEPRPCVIETDAGVSCTFDAGTLGQVFGPAELNFLGGSTEMPLFADCGTGVECTQTVLVEARLVDGQPRTVGVSVDLRGQVTNAGFQGFDGLFTIVPE